MVLKVEQHEEPTIPADAEDSQKQTASNVKHARKSLTDLLSKDSSVAVDLFSTAVAIKDVALAKQCAEIINERLNKEKALFILRHITKSKSTSSGSESFAPSAPPLTEENDQKQGRRDEDCLENLVENLRNNCLLEIDKNADYVLKHKDILELGYTDLLSIATRDTLQVTNELTVYSAIMRWSLEECKRRGTGTPDTNLKNVLGELVYAPRYGLMSKSDFLCRTVDGVKGPDRSSILTERETEKILSHIKRINKNQPGLELPFKGSRPRKKRMDNANFHSGTSNCSSNISTSACDKHIINILTCWTAVFD